MMPIAQATPWFRRIGPAAARSPLVCAVPHAGTIYPPALLAMSRVSRATLEQLEDRRADALIERCLGDCAVAIVATVARAWIDLNRGEDDLDPALRDPPGSGSPQSARARSGLGLLPRRVGRNDLWRLSPTPEAAQARIAQVHRPYHAAIGAALQDAYARYGFAVLIDCHSMPPLAGAAPARVVIGDRHGASAGHGIAARLARVAREHGFPAAINAPYPGAYTLERHGRPDLGIHALQIEIDRSLYLAPGTRELGPALGAAQVLVHALASAAIEAAAPTAIAAE